MEIFPLELILLEDYRNINSGEQICLHLPLSNDLLDDIEGGGVDVIVKKDWLFSCELAFMVSGFFNNFAKEISISADVEDAGGPSCSKLFFYVQCTLALE